MSEEAIVNDVPETGEPASSEDLERLSDFDKRVEAAVTARLEQERLKGLAETRMKAENISGYFSKFVDCSSEESIEKSIKELHTAIDDSKHSPNVPHFVASTTHRSGLEEGKGLDRKSIADIIKSGRKMGLDL